MPKENSVMTCERFMTVKHFVTCVNREITTRTSVVDMEVTTVAMADSSDVKVC